MYIENSIKSTETSNPKMLSFLFHFTFIYLTFAKATAETLYHPVGTCKMGSDAMAVTNEHGQVHGLEGLRVVDASLMPTLIGGNTNAPVIMMAEKISDHILGRGFLVAQNPQ